MKSKNIWDKNKQPLDSKYMNSFARKKLYAEESPRTMSGIWSTLDDDQKKDVVEYQGSINMSDEKYKMGLKPGEVDIVMARENVGKSVFNYKK